jgi:phosphoenolpyruvate synthase/pyruvate phosphate dikinase
MNNLRSRSRLRYTNLTNALREKRYELFDRIFQKKKIPDLFRRYEVELKKENKNEEYRELARGEIRSIDAAIPILKYEKFIFERK